MHDTRKHDGILWLIVAIACLILTDMAHGEGTQFEVGTDRTARWDAVTARENGRATTGAITYNLKQRSDACAGVCDRDRGNGHPDG